MAEQAYIEIVFEEIVSLLDEYQSLCVAGYKIDGEKAALKGALKESAVRLVNIREEEGTEFGLEEQTKLSFINAVVKRIGEL